MDTAHRLAQHLEGPPAFLPEVPESIEDTGLPFEQIGELILKHLYVRGALSGAEISDAIALPLENVLQEVLRYLDQEQLIERRRQDGQNRETNTLSHYQATDRGRARAREVMERNGYVGVAPVSLALYRHAVQTQAVEPGSVSQGIVRQALSHLVLREQTVRQIGPAVNSGSAMLLWGAPGNGKTATAEAIGKMLPSNIFIPHAIDIQGNTVVLYDPVYHQSAKDITTRLLKRYDQRWVRIKRPVIIAGSELNLEHLDLTFDRTTRTHRAPYQMKANNGVFLIDDFGRHAVKPQVLLNRWIMPLEKRRDFLTPATGQQVEVPFDTLIVFATNLDPHTLVDEAFLRRIRYKIEFPDPTADEFREIFRRACRSRGIPYHDRALRHLIKSHYLPYGRPFRACHPNDILDQLIDIARFNQTRPVLSKDLLDDAGTSYFVRNSKS